MKNLILIRHAKSSWKDEKLSDFERPLNKRGKRDAPFMGQILKKMLGNLDLIITSPATRTLLTAKKIAKELNYPLDSIKTDLKIYHAEDTELVKIIRKLSDKLDYVGLVGHNPSITDLSNVLTSTQIENVPTCGIVHIQFDLKRWEDVALKTGNLIMFEYPKKYLTEL